MRLLRRPSSMTNIVLLRLRSA